MSIDWSLLWHMGGYGAYVWTGWGVALLALGAEFFSLWRRSRRLPPPAAASPRDGRSAPSAASAPVRRPEAGR